MNHTIKRTFTALVLLLIVLLTFYSGKTYFIYLVHLFIFLLELEFALLIFRQKMPVLVFPFILHSFFLSYVFIYLSIFFFPALLISFVFSLAIILIAYRNKDLHEIFSSASAYTLGILYVGLLPSLVIKLLILSRGTNWLLLCLVVVFSGDIAAYFIGRACGKRKLMSAVSPSKTREGAIGGFIVATLLGTAFGYFALSYVPTGLLILACATSSLLAQSGDLFESLIKRVAARKDSGFLLPGHGGFLDRFDGVLFALPIFYAIALWS